MRVRVLALLSALALGVIAAIPANASSEGHPYLALGDSVSFGYNPLVDPTNINNFTGWPEIVAQRLNVEDVNSACPGEATGGFLSLTGTDNVCRPYRFVFNLPLHVAYATSQIDFATSFLLSHPRTRLVTLMLGANDFFRFQKDHPECVVAPQSVPCLLLLGGMLATMKANLKTIFSDIRATGYDGLIVALTYYALDYRDVSGALAFNAQMTAAAADHGVVVADGLGAWKATALAAGGSSCAAGLLIPLPASLGGGCDVHPTPKGRDLLAGAVINAIAGTCPAHSAKGCLNRS